MIQAFALHKAPYRAFSAAMLVFGQVSLQSSLQFWRLFIDLQVLAIVFQHVEYKRGNNVPVLLTFYWTLLTCVDIVRMRTYALKFEVCLLLLLSHIPSINTESRPDILIAAQHWRCFRVHCLHLPLYAGRCIAASVLFFRSSKSR
jgi:hypothetical protein